MPHTLSLLGFTLVITLVSANLAHAGDSPLATDMKEIGGLFKAISAVASDPTHNAQSAADAAKLIPLFTDAEGRVPDAITAMAPSQQPAAIADYKSLLEKEISDASALEAAFENGDNATAARLLADMTTLKVDGHTKYNP